jgi:hypothetical protein
MTKVNPEDCTGCKMMSKVTRVVWIGIAIMTIASIIAIPMINKASAKIDKIADIQAQQSKVQASLETNMGNVKEDISEMKSDIKNSGGLSYSEIDDIVNKIRRSVYGARDDIIKSNGHNK